MKNIVIIGGGPAGLSAAIYASRALLSPLVIEGQVPGGQLTLTTEVENYPGFAKGILGTQLMAEFREQAKRFGTEFITDSVVSIKRENKAILVKLKDQTIETKAVLIATGANAKWLGLEAETRLRGKGISACATCDGFFFKEKVVAVIGGGDSAMEEANFLTKFAKKVYLVHRRDQFRASKIMQERLFANPKIEIVYNAKIKEILGEDKLTGLVLEVDEQIRALNLHGMFVAIGHSPATSFLQGSGVELDAKGYIYTSNRVAVDSQKKLVIPKGKFDPNYNYLTSVPGIFAAGDCVDYQYRQATVAVGMGVAAELEVEKYLLEIK